MAHKIYIDNLRGFAIFIVVMGHCCEFCIGERHSLFNDLYYSFHMPLFMFISGLVAYKKDNISFKTFIKNKFNRLMVPMLTVGMLLSCYVRDMSISQFWLSDSKSGYWYLYVYFIILLLTFPAYKLSTKFNQPNLIWKDLCIFFFPLLILFTGVFIPTVQQNFDLLSYVSIMKLYPFFIMGLFISKYQMLEHFLNKEFCAFFAIVLSVITFCILRKFNYPISLAAYFIVPIIYRCFKMSNRLNKENLLTKLGG